MLVCCCCCRVCVRVCECRYGCFYVCVCVLQLVLRFFFVAISSLVVPPFPLGLILEIAIKRECWFLRCEKVTFSFAFADLRLFLFCFLLFSVSTFRTCSSASLSPRFRFHFEHLGILELYASQRRTDFNSVDFFWFHAFTITTFLVTRKMCNL